jgi:mono/diheme cytochrome c family protein
MKKIILAVLLNLSWAQEDVYKAKCAACHAADGNGSPAGVKMGAKPFSSPAVQKMSDAEIVDYIENGGPQKKPTHAFAARGVDPTQAAKLATYVKSLK